MQKEISQLCNYDETVKVDFSNVILLVLEGGSAFRLLPPTFVLFFFFFFCFGCFTRFHPLHFFLCFTPSVLAIVRYVVSELLCGSSPENKKN